MDAGRGRLGRSSKNIHDLILQMRVDCSTTDRNRIALFTGQTMNIDKFTNIPYIDDGTRAPNSTSTFHMTQ